MSAVIGALRVTLSIDTAAWEEGLKGVRSTLSKVGDQMKDAGKRWSAGISAPLAAMGGLTLKTAGDFEMAMNQVRAVSGATGEQFEALRDQAKELGATTQFSASQAAEAMNFLAMAGMESNEILAAMPDTLQLASSAQLDMASAADIVTNILAGYNKDVSELGHVTDVLVKAFTSANTDLRQLGEAMKYAGPVASAAGIQFEEAGAALALMGNAGIQASMAGTSLRGAVSRILNPTDAMIIGMQNAGLAFTDASGKLLPLADIIEQLEPHADNAGLFMGLFGQRAGPAMAALVSQGSDAVRELTAELENSAGTAAEISAVQMEGFNGAMRELWSAFEGLQIAIADSGLLSWATDATKAVAAWVSQISKTNPEILKWSTIIGGIAIAVGPVLIALGSLATIVAGISAPILAAVAAFAALSAVAVALYTNWDSIRESFPGIASAVETAIAVIQASFQGLLDIGMSVVRAIDSLFRGDFVGAFEFAAEAVTNWHSTLVNVFQLIVPAVQNGASAVLTAIKDMALGMLEAMKNLPAQFLEIGKQIISGLIDGIKSMASGAIESVTGIASGIVNRVKGVFDIHSPSRVMHEIGQNVVQGLNDGMKEMESDSTSIADSIGQKITSAFQSVVDGSKSVGDAIKDLLKQLAELWINRAFQTLLGGGSGGFLSGLFGNLLGFARGGSFKVGSSNGLHGIDSQLVAFRASPNETVSITRPDQERSSAGSTHVSVNVINNAGAEVSTSTNPDGSIDVIVDKMVARKLSSQGTNSNNALRQNFGARQSLISR